MRRSPNEVVNYNDYIVPAWDGKFALLDEADSAINLNSTEQLQGDDLKYRSMEKNQYLCYVPSLYVSGTGEHQFEDVKRVNSFIPTIPQLHMAGIYCLPTVLTIAPETGADCNTVEGFAVEVAHEFRKLIELHNHYQSSLVPKAVYYAKTVEDGQNMQEALNKCKVEIPYSYLEKEAARRRGITLPDTYKLYAAFMHSETDKAIKADILKNMEPGGAIHILCVKGMFGRGAGGTNIWVSVML
jgi:hypothetical protein